MDVPRAGGNRLALIYGSGFPKGIKPIDGDWVGVGAGGAGQIWALDAGPLVALPRHGRDRSTPAHLLDHHAQVRALCELGCGRVLALGSVGSLRVDWPVGSLVCPEDFLAPAVAPSFYDDDRGHSIPGFDPEWRRMLLAAWPEGAGELIDGGVYAQTRGPRFETPAEVRMLARDADLVGMTIAAEAILAREAGLAYAALCTIDNLANGLESDELTLERYSQGRDTTAPALLAALRELLPELAAETA